MEKQEFEIGQRVQYRSGGKWKPFGTIVDKEPPIIMNGAILVSPHYKVRWEADEEGNGDENDVSGWLSYYELNDASS